ncbi:hypothetical protein J6590_036856 [Homalodisca vitripennis]|nr:hypothetical protein J6590_036856 [Homalodisca vitripennis]
MSLSNVVLDSDTEFISNEASLRRFNESAQVKGLRKTNKVLDVKLKEEKSVANSSSVHQAINNERRKLACTHRMEKEITGSVVGPIKQWVDGRQLLLEIKERGLNCHIGKYKTSRIMWKLGYSNSPLANSYCMSKKVNDTEVTTTSYSRRLHDTVPTERTCTINL